MSLLLRGRECDRAMFSSARRLESDFDVIAAPRFASMDKPPGSTSCSRDDIDVVVATDGRWQFRDVPCPYLVWSRREKSWDLDGNVRWLD